MIDHLLKETDKTINDVDAIAYTAGPGLSGALLVGSVTANALAFSLGIPSIPVHHMEAHLLAPLLESGTTRMPFVALLVSGGHTLWSMSKNEECINWLAKPLMMLQARLLIKHQVSWV